MLGRVEGGRTPKVLAYLFHPECDAPSDDTVLWRYMDFTKFVDLVVTTELYLRRVDLLDDPREGLFKDPEWTRLLQRTDDMAPSTENSRSLSFVNCWCEGADESRAMWDLYGANARGIAIKTTMNSVRSAIGGSDLPIYIGRVEYVDWKQHDRDPGNLIGMCVRKSEGYRHEREVRLLFWSPLLEPVREPGAQLDAGTSIDVQRVAHGVMAQLAALFPSADFTGVNGRLLVAEAYLRYTARPRLQHADCGKRVAVNVATLIDEVVIGPQAPGWLLDLTRNVLERCNLSNLCVKVRSSELFAPRRQYE